MHYSAYRKLHPGFWSWTLNTKADSVYHYRAQRSLSVREFARLPVLMNGRVQPFDSVARNTLLQIRSTGDVPLEEVPSWKFWHHPKKLKSSEWLLEVLFKPELIPPLFQFLSRRRRRC